MLSMPFAPSLSNRYPVQARFRPYSRGKTKTADPSAACPCVELEGIEPSSKRGNHKLSTCLSPTSVFVRGQDRSHQPAPYPLKFHAGHEALPALFPILLCRFAKRFGTRAFERHPVSTTLAEIKLIYCTSIKQREHSFRCQIIF